MVQRFLVVCAALLVLIAAVDAVGQPNKAVELLLHIRRPPSSSTSDPIDSHHDLPISVSVLRRHDALYEGHLAPWPDHVSKILPSMVSSCYAGSSAGGLAAAAAEDAISAGHDNTPHSIVFYVEGEHSTELAPICIPNAHAVVDKAPSVHTDRVVESDADHHDHDGHSHDDEDHHGGGVRGGFQFQSEGIVSVRLPVPEDAVGGVVHVKVGSRRDAQRVPPGRSSLLRRDGDGVVSSYSTSTEISMQQQGINVSTIQQTNPFLSRSLVFLASGYTSSQRGLFLQDAQTAWSVLQGGDSTMNAAPWPRYSALLNVYTVFQPSATPGASGVGNNNLDCSVIGSDLSCSYSLIVALASYALVGTDMVVVLVNEPSTGAGISFLSTGIAALTTSATYLPYFLVHELNHAVGGLADEYTYGFNEPSPQRLPAMPNCATTGVAADVSWSYWVTKGLVDSTPKRGCSFDNFYRPTNHSCVMRSATATSMCSVCKETLTSALYTKQSTLSLVEPRCPPKGLDIYVSPTETTTLTINHLLIVQQSNISVTWVLHDQSTVSGVPSVTIDGATLQAGPNIVTATVVDLVDWVQPSSRPTGMSQVATFTLRPTPSLTCTTLTCTASTGVSYSYCGVCTTPNVLGTCGLTNRLITPTDAEADPTPKDVETARRVVTIVAVCLAAFSLLVIAVCVLVSTTCAAKTVEVVYDKSKGEAAFGILTVLTAVIGLALSIIMIVFVVLYLPRAAVFGWSIFVGILVLTSFVYVLCLLKFVLAVFHLYVATAVVGVLLFIFGAGLFGVGVFAIYVHENIHTYDVMKNMASLWEEYASDSPDVICSIQSAFQCSGYYASCARVWSSYCPRNCAFQNRMVTPCQRPWLDWVQDKCLPVGVVAIICGFFFAIAAAIDCIHCFRVTRAKVSALGRRSYRRDVRPPVQPITAGEIEQVRQEFIKADVEGKGTLEGPELVDFVQRAFNEQLSAEDRQAFLTAGPLTCDELLKLHFPHVVLARLDPRQLTPEEAEDAKDAVELQQLQYAKLEAFMRASGSLSPEALQKLYQDYAQLHFATNGKELLAIVQKASNEHDRTEEAAMCDGLSFHELEGLRSAWVAIKPEISGPLDDDQLDKFFQWTHGSVLHSHEHFVRWKDMLDVRNLGEIRWPEFCYPFAQRAHLARAREYLYSVNREVAHELLTRGQVAEEFGPTLVDEVFMVHEELIPIERVIEKALKIQEKARRQSR